MKAPPKVDQVDVDRVNAMARKVYGYAVPGRAVMDTFVRDGRTFVRARWIDRASNTPCIVTLPRAGN